MKISVLGCGWLGFPLAQNLLEEGHTVKGSTTSREKLSILKQAGIDSYQVELPPGKNQPDHNSFWDCDLLFLNIPPGRGKENADEEYNQILDYVLAKAKEHNISWIIFASSTSVYSEKGGLTSEDDAVPGTAARSSGETMLNAELRIQKSGCDWTILRFGGLYGYGRHPVKYLSGRNGLDGASKPVNLVHQVDCVRAVSAVIRQKKRNTIYNVVSDGHPPRKEFYQSAAEHFDLPQPIFNDDTEKNWRVVSNQKLKNELQFSFSYPNPMDHTP